MILDTSSPIDRARGPTSPLPDDAEGIRIRQEAILRGRQSNGPTAKPRPSGSGLLLFLPFPVGIRTISSVMVAVPVGRTKIADMMHKRRTPKPRNFWRTDPVAIATLVESLAGEITTAEAARRLDVDPMVILRQRSDLMRALDACYAARNEPNVTRFLFALNDILRTLADEYERRRLLQVKFKGGVDVAAAQGVRH